MSSKIKWTCHVPGCKDEADYTDGKKKYCVKHWCEAYYPKKEGEQWNKSSGQSPAPNNS